MCRAAEASRSAVRSTWQFLSLRSPCRVWFFDGDRVTKDGRSRHPLRDHHSHSSVFRDPAAPSSSGRATLFVALQRKLSAPPGRTQRVVRSCPRQLYRRLSRQAWLARGGSIVHDLPRRNRGASAAAADLLFERMAVNGESYWSVVYEPFKSRDLVRADLRAVVSPGAQADSAELTKNCASTGLMIKPG